MASASAVGSGRRCSRRSSGGVPRRANARSWVTTRRARPAALTPRRQLVRERGREPPQDEADRLESLGRGIQLEMPSAIRSGVLRGRNRSVSSPRARACSSAPSSPNRATSAERGSSATAPIVRSPNRASRARMSTSRVSSRAG